MKKPRRLAPPHSILTSRRKTLRLWTATAVIAIGLWTKRREATGDFLIANRSAGVVLTTASLSAVAGGLVLAGYTEVGWSMALGRFGSSRAIVRDSRFLASWREEFAVSPTSTGSLPSPITSS